VGCFFIIYSYLCQTLKIKLFIYPNGPFLVSRSGDMEKTKIYINVLKIKKILFNLDSRKVDMEVVNL